MPGGVAVVKLLVNSDLASVCAIPAFTRTDVKRLFGCLEHLVTALDPSLVVARGDFDGATVGGEHHGLARLQGLDDQVHDFNLVHGLVPFALIPLCHDPPPTVNQNIVPIQSCAEELNGCSIVKLA